MLTARFCNRLSVYFFVMTKKEVTQSYCSRLYGTVNVNRHIPMSPMVRLERRILKTTSKSMHAPFTTVIIHFGSKAGKFYCHLCEYVWLGMHNLA